MPSQRYIIISQVYKNKKNKKKYKTTSANFAILGILTSKQLKHQNIHLSQET